MKKIAKWAGAISNGLEKLVGRVVIFFAAVMVLDVLFGIVTRSVFNHPFFWTEELGRYAMIYSGCLAIGLALKRGLHVGITFMLNRIPSKLCTYLDVFVRVSITTFLIVTTYYSIEVCKIVSMQESPTMGFNMVWVFIVTPITCVLQLVFLALMTIQDIAAGFEGKHLAMLKHDADF